MFNTLRRMALAPQTPALIVLLASSISPSAVGQTKRELAQRRDAMVDQEIVAAGVQNKGVIAAMRNTPRHEFVGRKDRKYAYYDMALPIGEGQTISPPFVVAFMTEQLDPQPTDRVLEVGTGSGYQAAVLSGLVKEVYSIEIVESLGRRAQRTLRRLGYDNLHVRVGDGFAGWPEAAPFDKIIVTCSPEHVPQPLVEQLREGGKMVVPVGERYSQNLYLFTKQKGRLVSQALRATLFVPMTGRAEQLREVQPNPTRPRIRNGGFEEATGTPITAEAWHYQRQMDLVQDDPLAPEGRRYARFSNDDPGRGCRALQGFAVDGRKIAELQLRAWVRGRDLRHGQTREQWPRAVVTFYDQRRAAIGEQQLGPFVGTFDWREETAVLRVPVRAREAILRIGLLGAVGEISFDGIRLQTATPANQTAN